MPFPCHFCLKWSARNSRCSKCKSVFYCSRKCQLKDWKTENERFGILFPKHQKVCKEMTEDELKYRMPDKIDLDIKYHLPTLDDSVYKKWTKFQELGIKRAAAFNDPNIGYCFDETQGVYMAKYWNLGMNYEYLRCLDRQKMLVNGQMGIEVGGMIYLYEHSKKNRCEVKQALRNRPAIKLNMFMGETYVAVGFVDLTQLLVSDIDDTGHGIVRYVGIEMDFQKVARANMIYEMMKSPECDDKMILQVMYSMVITDEAFELMRRFTLKFLEECCSSDELHPEKREKAMRLLQKFPAGKLVSQIRQFMYEELSMSNLLKDPYQRLNFFSYCVSHSMFCTETSGSLWGNSSLFTVTSKDNDDDDNEPPMDSFFRMFDLSWLKDVDGDGNFFGAFESYLLDKMKRLRGLIMNGKVKCEFFHKKIGDNSLLWKPAAEQFFLSKVLGESIDNEDMNFIRSLKPSVIDWSNLIDHIEMKEFLQGISMSGLKKTVHVMYSFDWHNLILGSFSSHSLKDRQTRINAFEAARRQIRQDWNRILEEKPYLKKVFHEDGLQFHSDPLIEIVWKNYLKFKFIENVDKVGEEENTVRVVKIGGTDQQHVPPNYVSWGFEMALASQKINPKTRQDLVKKYVQI